MSRADLIGRIQEVGAIRDEARAGAVLAAVCDALRSEMTAEQAREVCAFLPPDLQADWPTEAVEYPSDIIEKEEMLFEEEASETI